MKISKYNFLKLIVKHFSIKMGKEITSEAELGLVVNSLIPAFNTYLPRMKKNHIIDDNEEIQIERLDSVLSQFFTTIPILNFPFGGMTIAINRKDVEIFIKDLRSHAIVDEVIYLPCH